MANPPDQNATIHRATTSAVTGDLVPSAAEGRVDFIRTGTAGLIDLGTGRGI